MHSINYTYEDEVNNRCFDMEISFYPVPYNPAVITADPSRSYPEEGGNCEDFCFKVVHAALYNDEGEVVKEDFTKEELEQFAIEFEDILDKNEKLRDDIDTFCTESYQDWLEYQWEEAKNYED